MKERIDIVDCQRIIQRLVFPAIIETKPHPQTGDKRYFEMQKRQLINKFGAEFFIEDYSADKMPHKIPMKVDIEDEKAIVIINKKFDQPSTISDESYIIYNLTEKIK